CHNRTFVDRGGGRLVKISAWNNPHHHRVSAAVQEELADGIGQIRVQNAAFYESAEFTLVIGKTEYLDRYPGVLGLERMRIPNEYRYRSWRSRNGVRVTWEL